jgi:ATP-binding cassette subfamily F protein 3
MLSVNNLSLSFGGDNLFQAISFQVNPGDRIGLVGRNGAGKSTLLKLLAGKLAADSGNVSKPSSFNIGFLTQDIPPVKGTSVWDEAASSFKEIKRLEAELERQTNEMSERTDYESDSYMELIEEFHKNQEAFQMGGGYTYQADLERVLTGLGFNPADFEKPMESFSGGWQMRVELAKILLQPNDLLLLDEPTNHLDIESILWLEKFLADSPQAIILVSHDRTFMNNATNRTLELVLGKAYDFNVPYFKYLDLRAEIREKQAQAKANQEKEIKHTEQLIERFRAKASKAAFAQSLIKRLDKMDRLEVDEEDTRAMRFTFPPAPNSGKVVARMNAIVKDYGPKKVLRGVDMELVRGCKVGFVGQNGQGKSTLVKILAEGLEHGGTVEWGHNVKLGYYAQNQAEVLDGDRTVLSTIEDAAPEEMRKNARKLLGRFMFVGDDVEKKVKVLSGGERGRLALCQLMLNPINVLVLDEPTNHLDMRATDVLKQALLEYDGALVVVSHDRDFMAGLCDVMFEFREGKTKQYLGGIEFFLEQRQLDSMRALEKGDGSSKKGDAKGSSGQAGTKAAPAAPALGREELKELERKKKTAETALAKTEEHVATLEAALAELDALLADSERYKAALAENPALYADYEHKQKALEHAYAQWEDLSAELEGFRSQMGS